VRTVAELVESDELIARLSELGIDYAQGFGISRPRALEEQSD
jgi:EAL domain-containing protein (putative c-di-GMP-specific phosphodiesterase class I)